MIRIPSRIVHQSTGANIIVTQFTILINGQPILINGIAVTIGS